MPWPSGSVLTSQPHPYGKAAFEKVGVRVMSIWWSRAELNSPKIIFSRWFWNIWTVSVRNGESRIHAVDGETACQRAVKWRFFRFGYKLATWSHGGDIS